MPKLNLSRPDLRALICKMFPDRASFLTWLSDYFTKIRQNFGEQVGTETIIDNLLVRIEPREILQALKKHDHKLLKTTLSELKLKHILYYEFADLVIAKLQYLAAIVIISLSVFILLLLFFIFKLSARDGISPSELRASMREIVMCNITREQDGVLKLDFAEKLIQKGEYSHALDLTWCVLSNANIPNLHPRANQLRHQAKSEVNSRQGVNIIRSMGSDEKKQRIKVAQFTPLYSAHYPEVRGLAGVEKKTERPASTKKNRSSQDTCPPCDCLPPSLQEQSDNTTDKQNSPNDSPGTQYPDGNVTDRSNGDPYHGGAIITREQILQENPKLRPTLNK